MKNILYIIFTLFAVTANSQSVKIQGFIRDAQGNPLEMASIMAVNQTTGKTDSYNITNDKGRFLLTVRANTAYTIQVSYIGFKPYETTVTTTTADVLQNILLEEGIELDGVEIVREMPVSVKGDTIVYNSDSFTNGTERKLEDILKKLPGIDVDEDGNIRSQGKPISKLMVEGKDFFDGDTKLGSKNIPADAVEKVEVLHNYSEVAQLKGVENNQDNVAMNIKLKEGKKNFWFGELSAGAGPDERYATNPKLFYYNPDYSLNFLGNLNNTGDLAFTMQDYFRFTGGLKNFMARGGTNFQLPSNEIMMMMMQNNRAKEVTSRFGAANFSYSPSKSLTLGGFGILSSTSTTMQFANRQSILNSATGEVMTTQNTNRNVDQDTRFGLMKFNAGYKPNKNLQLDYDVFLKRSSQEENSNIASTVVPDVSQSQDIYEKKEQHPFSINQNLNAYYTLNDKNIFAAQAQHIYQDEDPFYTANLAIQPFTFDGYITGQGRNILSQKQFVTTSKLDTKLDYYYVLNPDSNINFTLGTTNSYQNFNSGLYQTLDNGSMNNLPAPEDNNNVNYVFNDNVAAVHYKQRFGKLTVTPGISFHRYKMSNEQLGSTISNTVYRLLPDLNAIWQIKKTESLTYNFSTVNFITDVNSLAQGSILSNYNSLYRGNKDLESALTQSHSLRYSKFNNYSMENIMAYADYSRMTNAVSTVASYNGVNSTQSPYNSNFANQTLRGSFEYSRAIAINYKAGFTAAIDWASVNNIQRDPASRELTYKAIETFGQNYSARFSTNFKGWPSVTAGYSIQVNKYLNDTYYTSKPFASIEYMFLESFTFKSNYEFNNYTNKSGTVKNKYDFLNANISYMKKDGKLEYKAGVTNLLNTTALNNDSFSQFSSNTSRYMVQPRYFLFSLIYKI